MLKQRTIENNRGITLVALIVTILRTMPKNSIEKWK